MLPPIRISDFKGRLRLTRNEFDEETLKDYINEFYEEYLIKMIGAKAYEEIRQFPVPLPDKWSDLLLGVVYENEHTQESYKIEGLIETVKRFIFFEIARDYPYMTNTGFIRNKNENATDITPEQINAYSMTVYARSIEEYNCKVCPFIGYYQNVREDILGSTFDGLTTWTITTDCTRYLLNGDTVQIDCVDYVISDLVKNESFTIQADALFVVRNPIFRYEPYEIVQLRKLYAVSY